MMFGCSIMLCSSAVKNIFFGDKDIRSYVRNILKQSAAISAPNI